MRKVLLSFLILLFSTSAFANRLVQNSTHAERARGCVFSDNFSSEANVELNNGSATGSPVFEAADGVTLDGSSDYLTYNLTGQEFNSSEISIVIEFTPHFDYDEDAYITFFCDASTPNYIITKLPNSNNNALQVQLGGTNIENISDAAYGPYWKANQKNTLVVAGTSGSTSTYLNGQIIDANDTSVWSPTAEITLYIGVRKFIDRHFDGTIHRFQIFQKKLTDQEALDICNGTVYSYMDNALGIWQFRQEDHDPTNSRTLDSSGNGNHLTLQNSPDKISDRHGYRLTDGSSHYLDKTDASAAFAASDNFTVAAFFTTTSPTTENGTIMGKWNQGAVDTDRSWQIMQDGGNVYWQVSKDGSGGGGSVASASASINNKYGPNEPVLIVADYDFITDGTSDMFVYVQNMQDSFASNLNAPGPVHAGDANLAVGCFFTPAASNFFDGDILWAAYFDGIVLTPMQREDLKHRLFKQVNDQ